MSSVERARVPQPPPQVAVEADVAVYLSRRLTSAELRRDAQAARNRGQEHLAFGLEMLNRRLRATEQWAQDRQLERGAEVTATAEAVDAAEARESECPPSLDSVEVARRLGVTPRQVRYLARSGALSASQPKGSSGPWAFDPNAVDDYLASRSTA